VFGDFQDVRRQCRADVVEPRVEHHPVADVDEQQRAIRGRAAQRRRGQASQLHLLVGDDWAEDHHDLEIEDEAGRRLVRARLPEGLVGITRLSADPPAAAAAEPPMDARPIPLDSILKEGPPPLLTTRSPKNAKPHRLR